MIDAETDTLKKKIDTAHWETLTDKLTNGGRYVEFKTNQFTRKHANDKIF